MPSPIGHMLAGLSVGWLTADPPSGTVVESPAGVDRRPLFTPFVLWCAFVATIPDADLLIPHFHRTGTHSVTATALVLIIAAGVTGKVTPRRWPWTLVLALGAAHATHLVLDWLGVDRFTDPGIQLFWPFGDRFYISGLDIFPPVERRIMRPEAFGVNLTAALTELAIMGPVAAVSWLCHRRRAAAGSATAR